MPIYKAPLEDVRFVLDEIVGLDKLSALPGYEDATPELVRPSHQPEGEFRVRCAAPCRRGRRASRRWPRLIRCGHLAGKLIEPRTRRAVRVRPGRRHPAAVLPIASRWRHPWRCLVHLRRQGLPARPEALVRPALLPVRCSRRAPRRANRAGSVGVARRRRKPGYRLSGWRSLHPPDQRGLRRTNHTQALPQPALP